MMSSSVRRSVLQVRLAVRRVASAASSNERSLAFKDMLEGNPLGLPRLPIPTLEDTVARYLESLESLTRDCPEELTRVKALSTEFLDRDGPLLHAMVLQREKEIVKRGVKYPHSYIEDIWDDMYLMGRKSLPINSNPYIALTPAPEGFAEDTQRDPQVAHAARFLCSFLKWARGVRNGSFAPDSPPGCVHQYPLQSGTSRIPGVGRDSLSYHPGSFHVIVFCRGRAFRLDVQTMDGEGQLSFEAMCDGLEGVRAVASSPGGPTPGQAVIGHLTGVERDTWAAVRSELEKTAEINRASLGELDSALLTVALDDHDTLDLGSEGKAFLTGVTGLNRWFDKHQLVVMKNGSMAVNFEHSYSDGMAWTRMLGEIWHDMYGVSPSNGLGTHKLEDPRLVLSTPPSRPLELGWELGEGARRVAEGARRELEEACAGCTLDMLDFQDFGKERCKEWKISPDAVAQAAFQLAYLRIHGAMPATYESCSTRFFHRGRTETIRSCTSAMADFASVMGSESKSPETKRAALELAAKKHIEIAKAAQGGMGVDRHLLALRSVAARAEGRLGAVFFDDPLATRSSTFLLSTSNLSLPWVEQFGFGPTATAGYGMGYVIQDDCIRSPVTAFAGGNTDGTALVEEITRALRDIDSVYRR